MYKDRTVIIAEAGVNHNGDMAMARRLVDMAAEAGADYVKFQTFRAERCVSRFAAKADYQSRLTDGRESQLDMVKKLELSHTQHLDLMDYCGQKKIRFLSTGFDVPSVLQLDQLGVDFFKVGSGEITNRPLLETLGSLNRPVYLSTGMANLGEIESALSVLADSGLLREKVVLLHCNTEYPTPFEDVNLRAMVTLRKAFSLPVGYSDHTPGIAVSLAAVALGAVVIEKHLTVDRHLPGPDHQASLEGPEFAELVRSIRIVEASMGTGLKTPSPSESKNLLAARKSVVAGRAIRQGETFSRENLEAKRPGGGHSPMLINRLVGRQASRDYGLDEPIDEFMV